MKLGQGDIYAYRSSDGAWRAAKVLRVTEFGDHEATVHVLMYQSLAERPSLQTLEQAQVFVWHAPIALSGAAQNAEILGNQPVKPEELVGYHEYLKQTDFRTYLDETGQSSEQVIALSKAAYDEGGQLSDEKKYEEAIAAYDRAIDHFPFYWEAIDNKAFALMDLGRFEQAIVTFEESLHVEPDNPAAVFSIGECHLKMGDLEKAIQSFTECVRRWPDQKHNHDFLAHAKALAAKERPWWKKW